MIYDSGSVPRRAIFSPRETSPDPESIATRIAWICCTHHVISPLNPRGFTTHLAVTMFHDADEGRGAPLCGCTLDTNYAGLLHESRGFTAQITWLYYAVHYTPVITQFTAHLVPDSLLHTLQWRWSLEQTRDEQQQADRQCGHSHPPSDPSSS